MPELPLEQLDLGAPLREELLRLVRSAVESNRKALLDARDKLKESEVLLTNGMISLIEPPNGIFFVRWDATSLNTQSCNPQGQLARIRAIRGSWHAR